MLMNSKVNFSTVYILYCREKYVLHNLEKHLKPLNQDGITGKIKVDIDTLQSCLDKSMFEKVSQLLWKKKRSQLFLLKWRKKQKFSSVKSMMTLPHFIRAARAVSIQWQVHYYLHLSRRRVFGRRSMIPQHGGSGSGLLQSIYTPSSNRSVHVHILRKIILVNMH